MTLTTSYYSFTLFSQLVYLLQTKEELLQLESGPIAHGKELRRRLARKDSPPDVLLKPPPHPLLPPLPQYHLKTRDTSCNYTDSTAGGHGNVVGRNQSENEQRRRERMTLGHWRRSTPPSRTPVSTWWARSSAATRPNEDDHDPPPPTIRRDRRRWSWPGRLFCRRRSGGPEFRRRGFQFSCRGHGM